jgi:hypothetical protein
MHGETGRFRRVHEVTACFVVKVREFFDRTARAVVERTLAHHPHQEIASLARIRIVFGIVRFFPAEYGGNVGFLLSVNDLWIFRSPAVPALS